MQVLPIRAKIYLFLCSVDLYYELAHHDAELCHVNFKLPHRFAEVRPYILAKLSPAPFHLRAHRRTRMKGSHVVSSWTWGFRPRLIASQNIWTDLCKPVR